MDNLTLLAIPVLCLLLVRWLRCSQIPSLPLPPGPKGYPIIGNLLDMPSVTPWKTFNEWTKAYGQDVIFLNLPRQPTVVLGSTKAAFDLLDKRSAIYSDKPAAEMDELMTWDFNLAFMPYTSKWRSHRRMFHQHFNQREVLKYRPIQLRECRTFLQRALDSPSKMGQHIRQIYTAIILKITYDMDITDMKYEYILIAQEAMRGISVARIPGAFWIEHLPAFFRHIPSWVPGAAFKKTATYYRPFVQKMRNTPFDETVKSIVRQRENPSSLAVALIARLQRQSGKEELEPEQDELARNVTGIAYGAAADTTTSAAQSIFIAMSLNPDIQRKAQAELDRIVGPDRLPDFSDYDNNSLVYILAIALESMRWMVVLPLGVPHRVLCDDEYNGFFIPKGATVMANAWAMLHNPEDYPEPERFNPERYIKDGRLDPSVRNPLTLAFGFGRRICPGRYLSDASLFMTIATVLHTMTIKPVPGEDGKPIDPSTMATTGLVSSPEDVPCTISPRSKNAERLIRSFSDLRN